MTVVQFLRDILALLGAVSSVWFVLMRLQPWQRRTWRGVQRAVSKIVEEMNRDDFSPTLILGIGRGGAILGALISGALGHRPLIVVDRKYEWCNGSRSEDLLERLQVSHGLSRVLVVSGEVHTGKTTRLYNDYLRDLGAVEIRRATFYYQTGATERIEYKGFESPRSDLRLPWMFTKAYRRGSTSEKEAKGHGSENGPDQL